ncbi:PqqD family protein [Sphingobacterium cellulitidis]|uniref:PqqD family protein n=1 Tax=Sphingobacterium cellulitidis TaxID=1768011 RepID=UPI003C7AB29C
MRLRSDLILRKIGDEYLIVDPGKEMIDLSKVYSLNRTAAYLWDEMKGRDFSEDDVATFLVERYGLSPRQAYMDGSKLIYQFKSEKLIT